MIIYIPVVQNSCVAVNIGIGGRKQGRPWPGKEPNSHTKKKTPKVRIFINCGPPHNE